MREVGIKIVKDGSTINTRDPNNIVVDTRQSGAMKINQVIYQNMAKAKWHITNVKQTGSEEFPVTIISGEFRFKHGLGYPPPFIAYIWSRPADEYGSSADMMPSLVFGGYTKVVTTEDEIILTGIEDNSRVDDQFAVIIVFEENLESDD